MSIKVIGAGMSKTGTASLKVALEYLGFGKCYHCREIVAHHHHLKHWYELHEKGNTDFLQLFQGYQSTVDFPAIANYRELMEFFPDARVILSVRDPDSWYESASETIFKDLPVWMMRTFRFLSHFIRGCKEFIQVNTYVDEVMIDSFYKGTTNRPEDCKAFYNAWNEEVVKTVPAEKLLVYDIREGWEPLCRFLDKDVPDIPFPHENTREDYYEQFNKLFPFLFVDAKKLLVRNRGE